jgi:fucose permease
VFIPVSWGLTLFLGIESGGFQLVLLQVSKEFSLNAFMMGAMVTSQYIAITIAPLLFGWIADRIGKKPILLFFMLLFAGACIFTALSGSALFFVIGVFFVGMGYSVCECVGSSALSDSFPGKENIYLNIMQSTFSLGAVIGPLIFNRLLLSGEFTWRIIFAVPGFGYMLLYPFMIISRCQSPQRKDQKTISDKNTAGFGFESSRFILVLLFSMLVYVAMETGTAFFADSLFVLEFNNTKFGPYAISLFWFGMTISRLVFAGSGIRPRTMILLGFSLSAIVFIVIIFLKHEHLLLALFAVLGAMMGPVWPMILGTGTSAYQERSGTIASILTAAGGFGGAIIPMIIGFATEKTGLLSGFLLLAGISFMGFVFMKTWGKPSVKQNTKR